MSVGARPEGNNPRKIVLGYTISIGDFSYGFFDTTGEAAEAANSHLKHGMWTITPIASLNHVHPAHRQPKKKESTT